MNKKQKTFLSIIIVLLSILSTSTASFAETNNKNENNRCYFYGFLNHKSGYCVKQKDLVNEICYSSLNSTDKKIAI